MYTPIPDVEVAQIKLLSKDNPNDETSALAASRPEPQPASLSTRIFGVLLRLLTVLIWMAALFFGIFTLIHYLFNAATGHVDRWETTDPGLYRSATPRANWIMSIHMLAGVFLMTIGPVQLIPTIRHQFIRLHRWTGRLYLIMALIAAVSAVLFVVVYGTPRKNPHEDVNNVVFGSAAALCAVQSYRHVKVKRIQEHKLWSWRLYAVILGVLLYRFLKAIYGYVMKETAFHGNHALYNALFYTLVMPNLVVVEYLYRKQQHQQQVQPSDTSKSWFQVGYLVVALVFCTFGGFLIASRTWAPAILGQFEAIIPEYKR